MMRLCFAVLLLLAVADAQFTCSGSIFSPKTITSDVFVPAGAVCTLNGITVTGSVSVASTGALTTTGASKIFGIVSGTNCGTIVLGGGITVSGGVSLSGCQELITSPASTVASISVTNVNAVLHQGTTALLNMFGKVDLTIAGGSISGGGISRNGAAPSGLTKLCGAKIMGGIKASNYKGNLFAAAGAGCAPSEISGTIEVVKSEGNVNVGGGTLLGVDFILAEHTGSATISSTTLSDVAVKMVSGAVTFNGVTADSDAGITMVGGTVTVTKSAFDGDASFSGNPGLVKIIDNNFTLEDLLINKNGEVLIQNNSKFSFAASENGKLTVKGNTGITSASINKNSQTTISNNEFESVSCTDNAGGITVGAPNSAIFGTGQCATI